LLQIYTSKTDRRERYQGAEQYNGKGTREQNNTMGKVPGGRTIQWKRYQGAEQYNGKLLLLCHVPVFQRSTAFGKVSRLRPFVLLVTITGR
jgi:hypothetical protein